MEKIYFLVFKEKITKEGSLIVNNLTLISVANILSAIFYFIFNLIGSKKLGPAGYGTYTLIYSYMNILMLPMMQNLNNSLIKYNAESTDRIRRETIISTILVLILSFTFVSLLILILGIPIFVKITGLSSQLYALAVLSGFTYVIYTIGISMLISLHEMKYLAVFNIFYNIIMILIEITVLVYYQFTFSIMIYVLNISNALTGIIIVILFRRYIKILFDKSWAKKILKYNFIGLLGTSLLGIYTELGKILLEYFSNVTILGIYGVYYLGSIMVSAVFSRIIAIVIFPSASKHHNKLIFINKLEKSMPIMLLLGIPGMSIVLLIILHLFGSEYPLNYFYVFVFAVASVLTVINTIGIWIYNSEGINGAKQVVYILIALAGTSLILNIVLIPFYQISGAIFSLIIANILGIFVIILKKDSLRSQNDRQQELNSLS